MNAKFPVSRASPLPFTTGALTVLISLVLAVAIRDLQSREIAAIVVAAITIAILDLFPIYLNPIGELRLTIVILIPTLVLFSWPTALIGAAIGMSVSFIYRSPRDAFTRTIERLSSLMVAAALSSTFSTAGPNQEVASAIFAGLGYAFGRTIFVSGRMHVEESIGWSRAIRFLASATFFHLGFFTGVAAIAVWTISNDPSTTSRLLIPVLAASVTLQIYLPRILRGREQQRVLAAVSVLAAAVDAKDPYTANHSAEVAELSRRVARILNLDEPEVHLVYLAGLLHDVGKTVVPPAILLKPEKLTDEEWRIMQSHVDAGVRIVESIHGLAEIAPIVGASHERLDGRGYPQGLKADDIPVASRIILLVDAYNALTTNRPYRAARSTEKALSELEAHAGTQFDPKIVPALREALEQAPPRELPATIPTWTALLRQPAFALLWVGELVSFVGDDIFFIALSLWVYQLTGSITTLATTLVVATVGQGLLGLLAGALVDRWDRRSTIIVTDIVRALIVASIPFVLPVSIPGGLALVMVLNVGTVFFRSAVYALIPSIVRQDELPTANALFQTTERFAEVIGGVVGGAIVLIAGYRTVFFLDAASFFASTVCVVLMPVMWRAGLSVPEKRNISTEISEGLRYIWQVPLQRVLALLVIPGYLTLAFSALQTPMIRTTAGLSVMAFGVINSAVGAGKLASAVVLSGARGQWARASFVVIMYLITAVATIAFGLTTAYPILIASAFLFGMGNVATNIANATLTMANTPSGILGRVIANRQVFIALVKVTGTLAFGRLADLYGPPAALVSLGLVSGLGVTLLWLLTGRPGVASQQAPAPRSVSQ